MTTSAARKATTATRSPKAAPLRSPRTSPVVVYAGRSLDGTTFALDVFSQERIRKAYPGVNVSTRHIFIAHDTHHEDLSQSIERFAEQVAILLTGLTLDRLAERFQFMSFRDPGSEQEIRRLPLSKLQSR